MVSAMLKKLDLAPCTLGEGPLWHEETGEFAFTDIVNGRLYACTPEGETHLLLQCRYQLGAFLFDEAGDLLLLTEAGVFACPYGAGEEAFRPVWQVPMAPGERFNDAICDPAGRVLAGTKTPQNENGSLWLFENGRPPRRLLADLRISNGMGFARNGTVFYHTDSGDRAVRRYVYSPREGALAGGRVLVRLDSADGAVPDGMTVDADGCLWTACWGGGHVARWAPDGRLLAEIPLPASQVSSVAFGGAGLGTLLVTSAAVGTAGGEEGGTWLLDVGAQGVPEYRAARPAALQAVNFKV